ncbi:acetyl-CoA acetyltransferase [Chloroflexota bacterium]
MEGINDKVAIVGMGCTKFGENWGKDGDDLIVEAVYEALENAGIELKDIQAAWIGTRFTGRTGLCLSAPLRLQYIPVTRVENLCASGTEAIRAATYAVAAGACDIALAVGVEKLKDSGIVGLPPNPNQISPIAEYNFAPAKYSYLAMRYFKHYNIDTHEGKGLLAQIAVKNHHNGNLAPKAHFHQEITVEQAVNAPIVSWPLGLFDCCGVSDGAAAAIVTRADIARSFREDPIYIKALAVCAGPRDGSVSTNYDFTHIGENVHAGEMAYAQAGIKDPLKELSLAEVHDCFTITEMVIYEDLKWCPRGRAKEYIEDGTFTLKGELPVNTDGGLKCFGHPIGASGLRMLYEVYTQLQGRAGPRQVDNPKLGLTHNLGGAPGGGVASVCIVGNQVTGSI